MMKKNTNRFIVNVGLFILGIVSAFSGMLIQIKYHMGHHGNISATTHVLGINYQGWSAIHKISIVALSLLMVYHVCHHWKWYKAVISKKLIAKHQQVLVLSLLFVLVAITGLVSWFIHLLNGDELVRKVFIEIHDKITLLLVIYLVLHVTKRIKWFFKVSSENVKKGILKINE